MFFHLPYKKIEKKKINNNIGFGYFANQDIDENTIIFSEKIKIKSNYDNIKNMIMKLNENKKKIFLTFMPFEGKLEEKIICNAFSINGEKDNVCILFESRFFNHSCTPNTNFIFDTKNNKIIFITNQKILRNQELTISYINNPNIYTLYERRYHLYHQYHFFCNCDKCIYEHKSI